MAYDFKFPDVGQGITEGKIVKWHVRQGDTVKEDAIIAEIETDKAVVEVPSPKSGTIIKRFSGGEGSTIQVGESLVVIGEKGEKIMVTMNNPQKDAGAVVGKLPDQLEDNYRRTSQSPQNRAADSVKALPSVRKLAKELNVNLATVKGTGGNGRITQEDVKAAGQQTQSAAPETSKGLKVTKKYDFWGMVKRTPLQGIRKITAEKMVQASTKSALVTNMEEADITEMAAVREQANAAKQMVRLSYLPFIMKCVVEALKKHPEMNSEIDEAAQEIVVKDYQNIGVAVATPQGLLVPVIKRAATKSIMDMAKELETLAEKARTKKIDLADLQGSSFTISNIGSIGATTYFTPIVNFPETAILGIGRISDKPVVQEGKVVIRKMMPLSLTYDHRVVDGAQAAQFMKTLIASLENPKSFNLK
jgi:pyruvate dehydrogenase E2 component (dihydrolipoamide acetyltransferase)